MFSDLERDQGGRETWLRYFVDGIASDFGEVIVHSALPMPGVLERVRQSSSVLNFIAWLLGNLRAILVSRSNRDVFIYCGVPLESSLSLLLRWLRPGAVHIIWVRGRGVDELRAASSHAPVLSRFVKWVAIGFLGTLERSALSRSDVIFNGVDTEDHFRQKYGLRGEFTVIPNAHFSEGVEEVPDEVHEADGKWILGYVGRLVETKGYSDFQALASRLSGDSRIAFHSWGPNVGEYKDVDEVSYNGALALAAVIPVLRSLDAVLFLNRNRGREAAGVSHGILEAMAAGCLIVAWRNETHLQLLSDDCAILVAEGDILALERAVYRAVNLSDGERSLLVDRAAEIAEEYSVPCHVGRFRAFLYHISEVR